MVKKAKSRAQQYYEKVREEIKDCKNGTFEKDIISNLETWAFWAYMIRFLCIYKKLSIFLTIFESDRMYRTKIKQVL